MTDLRDSTDNYGFNQIHVTEINGVSFPVIQNFNVYCCLNNRMANRNLNSMDTILTYDNRDAVSNLRNKK